MSKNTNTGYWNTGNSNTGNRNTGCWNTGYSNTGYSNTGNSNTGNSNTGNSNTGSFHVGCFNTVDAEKAYYFNTLIDKAAWEEAYKPDWLNMPSLTTWISSEKMTAKEKVDNPSHETTGGYLRVNDMKEEWRKAYESASPEDIQAVRDLPAFDYDVFEQIAGLDLREEPMPATCEGREIEIDGVTYVLKLKGKTMSDDRRSLNSIDDIEFAVRRIEELEAKLSKSEDLLAKAVEAERVYCANVVKHFYDNGFPL